MKNNFLLTDRKLLHRLQNRIYWDKRISTSDFHVHVHDRCVTLSGCVDTEYKKRAAFEVVSHTDGVLNVINMIVVPNHYFRSDSELKKIVEDRLANQTMALTERISVDVKEGRVKLSGVVHSARKKAEAAGFVWELSGVVDFINLIEIVDPPKIEARTEIVCLRKTDSVGASFLECFDLDAE